METSISSSELRNSPALNFENSLRFNALLSAGRVLFAAAMALFGILCALFAAHAGTQWPQAGPPWAQTSAPFAALTALGFLATAIGIVLPRYGRVAAMVLAAGILLRALVLFVPKLLGQLHNPGPWTGTFELLAIGGAALVLASTFPTDSRQLTRPLALTGQALVAFSLTVFGVQHFLYAGFVATLIPTWIPARLFWAYATGTAFFVSAASLLVRRLVEPIMTLLAAMFLLWVAILHAPRVAAAPHNGDEWTSLGVALAMGAAALVIARSAGSEARKDR
ncbi:MAG: hypothetical protein M3Y50_04170 [Acidobacteriota bacterium]|nr:hypothetical protein [Acidobacteriota bacterium]